MGARLVAMDSAALASSIFLVARKREGTSTGSYEDDVRPELEQIVRERVETLWEMGLISLSPQLVPVCAHSLVLSESSMPTVRRSQPRSFLLKLKALSLRLCWKRFLMFHAPALQP